jgi:HAMP domain-containing protein
MQTRGATVWAGLWAVAVVLALLLFAGMSLLALRAGAPLDGMPAPALTTPAPSIRPSVTPGVSVSGADEPTEVALAEQAEDDPSAAIGLWLSALSAITALVGLVSTLWLGWRKERREVAQHQVELEKLRLEVQKLQRELRSVGGDKDGGAGEGTGADDGEET